MRWFAVYLLFSTAGALSSNFQPDDEVAVNEKGAIFRTTKGHSHSQIPIILEDEEENEIKVSGSSKDALQKEPTHEKPQDALDPEPKKPREEQREGVANALQKESKGDQQLAKAEKDDDKGVASPHPDTEGEHLKNQKQNANQKKAELLSGHEEESTEQHHAHKTSDLLTIYHIKPPAGIWNKPSAQSMGEALMKHKGQILLAFITVLVAGLSSVLQRRGFLNNSQDAVTFGSVLYLMQYIPESYFFHLMPPGIGNIYLIAELGIILILSKENKTQKAKVGNDQDEEKYDIAMGEKELKKDGSCQRSAEHNPFKKDGPCGDTITSQHSGAKYDMSSRSSPLSSSLPPSPLVNTTAEEDSDEEEMCAVKSDRKPLVTPLPTFTSKVWATSDRKSVV